MTPRRTSARTPPQNRHTGRRSRERGLEWTHRALGIDPNDPMILYNVAWLFSLAGEVERAIDTLERAVAAGLRYNDWIEHDVDFDPLRENPRFQELMAQL